MCFTSFNVERVPCLVGNSRLAFAFKRKCTFKNIACQWSGMRVTDFSGTRCKLKNVDHCSVSRGPVLLNYWLSLNARLLSKSRSGQYHCGQDDRNVPSHVRFSLRDVDRQPLEVTENSHSRIGSTDAIECLLWVKRGHPRSHCQSPLIPQEQTFRSKFVLSSTIKSFALGLISVSPPTGDGNSTFALQKKALKNTAAKNAPLIYRSRVSLVQVLVPPSGTRCTRQKNNASKRSRIMGSMRATSSALRSVTHNILRSLWFCCLARDVMSRSLEAP
jgi:hypothetical protein